MINKENIKFFEPIYYVPTYSDICKVSIGKLVSDNVAIVKPYSKKKDFKAFPIAIEHIYENPIAAKKEEKIGNIGKERIKR